MARLADLDIEVWFDIYFHGDDFLCEGQSLPPKPSPGEDETDSSAKI